MEVRKKGGKMNEQVTPISMKYPIMVNFGLFGLPFKESHLIYYAYIGIFKTSI